MDIIKTLKAEEKILEKKLRAIRVSLQAAFNKFRKEEGKRISSKKRAKPSGLKRKVRRGAKAHVSKGKAGRTTRRAAAVRAAA